LQNSLIIPLKSELTEQQIRTLQEDNERVVSFVFGKMNKNTHKAYFFAFKKFFETLPQVSLKEINIGHIQLYRLKYLNKKSLSTQRQAITLLNAFFQHLYDERYIERNPFKTLKLPKQGLPDYTKKVPAVDEIDKLIEVAKSSRDKVLIEFLYLTGLRISEALNLKFGDFKADKNNSRYVAYFKGKGGSDSRIVISSELYSKLDSLVNSEKQSYLFKSSKFKEKSITSNAVAKLFKNLSLKARLKYNINPHALRHAHGTHALANGATLEDIKVGLNHSSLQSTFGYTKSGIKNISSDYLKKIDKK